MSLSEFVDLVTSTGVVDDNFGAREINTIFRISMATQIDEIRNERHTRMQFLEFVEAISRVADRVIMNLVAEGGTIVNKETNNLGLQQIDEEEADYQEGDTVEADDGGASSRGRGRGSDSSSNDGNNSRENSSDPNRIKIEGGEFKKEGGGMINSLNINKNAIKDRENIQMSET
jgi:hypothetical protein